jgi:hypothetical protein
LKTRLPTLCLTRKKSPSNPRYIRIDTVLAPLAGGAAAAAWVSVASAVDFVSGAARFPLRGAEADLDAFLFGFAAFFLTVFAFAATFAP